MNHNGKVFHIQKSTAVWLFQECERVSTDRLFRVQSKQPYSSSNTMDSLFAKSNSLQVNTLPTKLQTIKVGDICVFTNQGQWKNGKVLQFYYHEGKTQKARQCSQTCFNLTTISKGVSVVCSWFSWHPPLSLQTFSQTEIFHSLVQSIIMHLLCQLSVLNCYKQKNLVTVLHRVFWQMMLQELS